jgi:hypothetical protein
MPYALRSNDTIAFFGDSQVFFGTSSSKGFVNLIRNEISSIYPNARVLNFGARDGHLESAINDLETRISPEEPTKIFLMFGLDEVKYYRDNTENFPRFQLLENFETDLDAIVRECAMRKISIIVCSPLGLGEKYDGSNEFEIELEEISAAAEKIAKKYKSGFIDIHFHALKYLETYNWENLHEGILTLNGEHFNESGHMFLTVLLLKTLGVQNHPYYDHPLLDKSNFFKGYYIKDLEGEFARPDEYILKMGSNTDQQQPFQQIEITT